MDLKDKTANLIGIISLAGHEKYIYFKAGLSNGIVLQDCGNFEAQSHRKESLRALLLTETTTSVWTRNFSFLES